MEQLKEELRKEISLLESWIRLTNHGGWSTHLNTPMQNRINELKVLLYDL